MPTRFLLIDGYNLLHAAGMARANYGPGDLQRCRGRLLRYLFAKLTPAEISRTTIVFDARDPPPDRPSRFTIDGLHVVFANPGGDADVVISELLSQHSAPQRTTLVSSDHQLQTVARRRRVKFTDSDVFFDELERRRRPAAQPLQPDPKETGRLSDVQTAYWLKEFGEIPEAADLAKKTLPQQSDLDRWLAEFGDLAEGENRV